MKSFWDHTVQERAKLDCEDVERLLSYELMEKGVLRPVQPELEDESAVDLHQQAFYRVVLKFESYGSDSLPLLFSNPEEARKLLDLDWRFEDFEYGEHCARKIADFEIASVDRPYYDDLSARQSDMSKARQIKARNSQRQREYDDAMRAVTKATKAIWDDWHASRDHVARLNRIRSVFDEYLAMAEKHELAMKFLLKVSEFTEEEILEALPEYADELRALMDAPRHQAGEEEMI